MAYSKASLSICITLCLLLCAQRSSATRTMLQDIPTNVLKYVDGQDPKGQNITIPPLTVWTWCGFNSMEKITAEVNATRDVGLYISPKRTVKTAELTVLGLPGDKTCRGKDCKKSMPGRFLKYNRCVAVGNFDINNSLEAKIKVKSEQDTTVTGIIAGIVIACVGALVCCIVSWLCCLKKIVCCCC